MGTSETLALAKMVACASRGNKINSFDKARALDPNDARGKAFKAEYDKAKAGDVKIKC